MPLNTDLVKDNLSVSDNGETFHTSKECFHNFKARTGIHSVTRYGEAIRADKWLLKCTYIIFKC